MSSNNNYLLVIGSGPGIGLAVSRLFAQKQFSRIALISRNTQRLESDKQSIISAVSAGGSSSSSSKEGTTTKKDLDVRTHSLDIADLATLRSTLATLSADSDFGRPECVFFNAARVRPSPLLQESVEEIEYDFRITNLALYEVAKWAMPGLVQLAADETDARPSLIVTSSLLHVYPIPDLFSLSMTKAAQRTLVRCLADRYHSQGVHVALVSVGGAVADGNQTLNAKVIAERIWALYRQEKGAFSFDTEILEESPSQI